ncbi:TRAP transporter large permease [Bacillus dakarensis]|uniref:TRAP transporter large permease n=1 Tax=Robertmurraya dakarensis TaxID=1926278 RepID=UPI00098100C7|nr:TRAP transporter large permease [Bacillus dakarensis]
MPLELIGFIGIMVMFVLMFLRFPISIAMAIPAFLGIIYVRDWGALTTAIETIIWDHSFSYTLTTIPMFVLMGELLFVSGISDELFQTFRHWMGRLRGGLGIATVGASAIFSAASGSSLATTGTMGVIASKEMLKSGYDKSLASGSIVAGGTLGILIPPSTMFIIYGMLTEQSIGQLLIAGIIPGILLTTLYMLTIYLSVLIKPSLAPSLGGSTWKERFSSLKSTIWILLLFVLVIGGMYFGFFSPTEAAGVGAFGAVIIALVKRKLTVDTFVESASRTLRTTGFLFAIILAAFILNYFLAITKVPILLAEVLTAVPLPPFVLFALIILIYVLLGAVMDSLAMIVVTIPIILPIINALGFDLIWFGVIIVIVVEMALISPPVGMNCFVLNGVAPELKLETIFKGAIRFVAPILILIALLYVFPEIALYLPSKMM